MLAVVVAVLVINLSRGDGTPGSVPSPTPEPAPAEGDANATVTRVVDGDTLAVEVSGDEERLRLIGVDTPESVATDRPNECFGHEASEHLADLLPAGTPVRLERDVEARDRYDRLLAYVYLPDGANYSVLAAHAGAARSYVFNHKPVTQHAAITAAEAQARAAHKGLWGACPA